MISLSAAEADVMAKGPGDVGFGELLDRVCCDASCPAAGCAAMDDMACRWSPWGPGTLENCVEVEDWSCDEVAALL